MTDAACQPVELLTARELAARVGKSRRTLLEWAGKGCPHTVEERAGRPCKLFDPAEVDAWRREHGLDGTPPEAAEPSAEPPAAGGPPPSAPGVPMGQVAEFVRGRLRAVEAINPGKDPANAQRLATAVKNLSGELRALEEAAFRAEERAGKYIPRERVESLMITVASQFVADLETLAADIPREVAKRLEADRLPPTDYVALQRVMGQVVRGAIDKRREERALSLEATARELGGGG